MNFLDEHEQNGHNKTLANQKQYHISHQKQHTPQSHWISTIYVMMVQHMQINKYNKYSTLIEKRTKTEWSCHRGRGKVPEINAQRYMHLILKTKFPKIYRKEDCTLTIGAGKIWYSYVKTLKLEYMVRISIPIPYIEKNQYKNDQRAYYFSPEYWKSLKRNILKLFKT